MANIFEQECHAFLSNLFPICMRLPDIAYNRYGGRQTSKRPWDFYGCTEYGVFWVAEAKSVRAKRFPKVNLRPEQREALHKVEENGGHAFILINWRIRQPPAGYAVCVPFNIYQRCENGLELKSVAPIDIPHMWFLKRVSGGWDFADFDPKDYEEFHLWSTAK